jgi:prepilin-type N-terminal cleavage/methylation domain-containing protein
MLTVSILHSAMSIPTRTERHSNKGFTIIEVLIVLAIASLIMLIVFLAVPALQRNWRNQQRHRDASLLYAAINECMTLNFQQGANCNWPDEIPFEASSLGIYTGFHYGSSTSSWPDGGTPTPPTIDEPNWLFSVKCNETKDFVIGLPGDGRRFVVAYIIESPNGLIGRCFDNT